MFDCLIVGAGPAGVSAGIYLKRMGFKPLIVSKQNSSLFYAKEIENYYGFKKISGEDLYNFGVEQARALEIDIVFDEVIDIKKPDDFIIKTVNNTYQSKSVIIATGALRNSLNVSGIKEYTGYGISYCATCDGFLYKNKKIAIIGNGDFALEEAKYLGNLSKDIVILTNGLDGSLFKSYEVYDKKIKAFQGLEIDDDFSFEKIKKLSQVVFEDDTTLEIDACFIALGTAGGFNFAKQLGAILNKNKIVTNNLMETSIQGLYACGDVTEGMLQIAKAVYEGAVAGTECGKYLKK